MPRLAGLMRSDGLLAAHFRLPPEPPEMKECQRCGSMLASFTGSSPRSRPT